MHRKKNFILILFIVWGTSHFLMGQNNVHFNEILWGDVQKLKSTVESMSATADDKVLVSRFKSPIFRLFSRNKPQYTFGLLEGFSLQKNNAINLMGNGKKSGLVNYTFIGNSILALSHRNTFSGINTNYFYHYINPNQKEKSNHGYPLSLFESIFRNVDLSRVHMISSANREFASILYIPVTKPKEFSTIKFAIFKNDQSAPIENEFIFPYSTREYKFLDFLVLNDSNQLFISGIYPDLSSLNKAKPDLSRLHYQSIEFHSLQQNSLASFSISSAGLYFANMELIEDDEVIYVSGFYSTHMDGNVEGMYLVQLDRNGEIVNETFNQFTTSQQLLINNFRDNYASSSYYSDFERSGFRVIAFQPIDDGFIHVSEYNAIEYRYGGADMGGSMHAADNTYFWSGDLIVTKLDANGNVSWMNIVPKVQRTINDGGYYLSSSVYIGANNLHLFFNDNLKNYDEDEQFHLTDKTPKLANFGIKNNTIAHVSINLENGESQRMSTIGKSETKVFLVPQLSVAIPSIHTLFIYGRSDKKHRFGSVIFNE